MAVIGTSNFPLLTMGTTAIQYPAHSLVSFYGRSHKSHNKKTNFRQGQGVHFSRKNVLVLSFLDTYHMNPLLM